MGEQYDPSYKFTVEELMAYQLGSHREVIDSIYSAAIAEFAIEMKLEKVKKLWEEKDFKLAKHIPDSMYKSGQFNAFGKIHMTCISCRDSLLRIVLCFPQESQGQTAQLLARK